MKKLLALLLAAMMIIGLAACGGGGTTEPTPDPTPSSGVAADNTGAEISDEQLVALTEAYNQVAPLYNDVYTAAEANGWLADEQTATEIQAVGGTLGVIGQALTEDLTMLDGSDFDALPDTLLLFVPELEKMAERVSVPYAG